MHTPDKDRPYGAVLSLIDVNYLNVDFYYCIKNDSLHLTTESMDDLKSTYKASEIYLYVNGKCLVFLFVFFFFIKTNNYH